MPKRTYQPKRKKRARKLGFLSTKKRKLRSQVVKKRRRKGRQKLTPV